MIFPTLRWILDYSIGFFPIPLYYLFIALAFYWLVKALLSFKNLRYSFWNIFFRIFNFWGWIFASFYFIWGFNYQRPELHEKLELVVAELKVKGLEAMATSIISSIESLQIDDLQIGFDIENGWEKEIRVQHYLFLESVGYRCTGLARVKRFHPEGVFRRIGISGMYLPWVGQGNVDASLSNFEYPFIASHEMAHAHGVTDEGEASFVAYVTCTKSENPMINYSAELFLLRNILFEMKMRDELLFEKWMGILPSKVKFDLQKIRENMQRFPDVFPKLSEAVNDTYLKAQGVESGSSSYGELINLVYAWKNQY